MQKEAKQNEFRQSLELQVMQKQERLRVEKLNKEKMEKEILRISEIKPELPKFMEQIDLSPPRISAIGDQRLDRNFRFNQDNTGVLIGGIDRSQSPTHTLDDYKRELRE